MGSRPAVETPGKAPPPQAGVGLGARGLLIVSPPLRLFPSTPHPWPTGGRSSGQTRPCECWGRFEGRFRGNLGRWNLALSDPTHDPISECTWCKMRARPPWVGKEQLTWGNATDMCSCMLNVNSDHLYIVLKSGKVPSPFTKSFSTSCHCVTLYIPAVLVSAGWESTTGISENWRAFWSSLQHWENVRIQSMEQPATGLEPQL